MTANTCFLGDADEFQLSSLFVHRVGLNHTFCWDISTPLTGKVDGSHQLHHSMSTMNSSFKELYKPHPRVLLTYATEHGEDIFWHKTMKLATRTLWKSSLRLPLSNEGSDVTRGKQTKASVLSAALTRSLMGSQVMQVRKVSYYKILKMA